MQPGASVCSQKKDKLSNTFFQWLPLEFLIPVQKTASPEGERKVMAGEGGQRKKKRGLRPTKNFGGGEQRIGGAMGKAPKARVTASSREGRDSETHSV